MNRKIVLLPVIVIISFVVGFIYLMKGCLSSHNTYGVVGRPAVSDDGKNITVLVAESEATSYQENGGYRSTSYSTSYWLKQYETATGKLLQKKKIASGAEKQNLEARCFGGYGGIIWLHSFGLKGYSLVNLEEIVNEEKLSASNGFDKRNFPEELKFIDEAVANGHIIFTAQDGGKFVIDLASQKIKPYEDTPVDKEAMIQEMLGRYSNAGDQASIRCDTFNASIFTLAKDSLQAAESRPGDNSVNDVAYRMRFFKNDYKLERLGGHNSFEITKVTQQGNTSYLNGRFAGDDKSGKAIQLYQPEGYLIIHQDIVGSNAKAIITRVDTSNNKIWESAIGVSTKVSHSILMGHYCIITTNTSYKFSPHIGKDALCIVDTQSGKILLPDIKQ